MRVAAQLRGQGQLSSQREPVFGAACTRRAKRAVAVAEPCPLAEVEISHPRGQWQTLLPAMVGTAYDWERKELERMYEQAQPCCTSTSTCQFSEPLTHLGSPGVLFAVQLGSQPEPPKQKHSKERHDDFYANVGDAIRTLRDDIPDLFKEDLNYDIYRPDVVFRDPKNSFQGIKNYKLIFWSLRFHGRIFFKDLFVEVKRIWQKEDDSICMRWTVHGIPRVPWEAEGLFDGVSNYKLDSHGKIYEHKVDNVILRGPPLALNPLLMRLNLSPIPQSQPCPGSWGYESETECGMLLSLRRLYYAAVGIDDLPTRV